MAAYDVLHALPVSRLGPAVQFYCMFSRGFGSPIEHITHALCGGHHAKEKVILSHSAFCVACLLLVWQAFIGKYEHQQMLCPKDCICWSVASRRRLKEVFSVDVHEPQQQPKSEELGTGLLG